MNSSLTTLPLGTAASISAINASEGLFHRLAAMGFRVGKSVQVMRRAAFSGPIHVRVGSTDIIIRHQDARCIELLPATL
jgi:ferrous iron transport protein A